MVEIVNADEGAAKLINKLTEILSEHERAMANGRPIVGGVGRSWTWPLTDGCTMQITLSVRIDGRENGSTPGNTDLDQGIPGEEQVDG